MGKNIIEEILLFTDRILEKIPEDKRRFFIIILGGLIFLVICLTVITLASGSRVSVSSRAMTTGQGIPAEELFYPEEPDFLPPLLLERYPQEIMTAEILEDYWQDPKTGNEEEWREVVNTVINRLMEGVP